MSTRSTGMMPRFRQTFEISQHRKRTPILIIHRVTGIDGPLETRILIGFPPPSQVGLERSRYNFPVQPAGTSQTSNHSFRNSSLTSSWKHGQI